MNICISREFGSGGHEIGKILAEQLGYSFYDRRLLEGAAEKSRIPIEHLERADEQKANPWIHRIWYEAEDENLRKCPEKISGMPNEDKVPEEGAIYFDIRFRVLVPEGNHVQMIINVEAQKSFYPGYEIVTRGIFYSARMISAQSGVDFSASDYKSFPGRTGKNQERTTEQQYLNKKNGTSVIYTAADLQALLTIKQ